MTATQLGIRTRLFFNGQLIWDFPGGEIAGVSIVRSTTSDTWILTAGGKNGNKTWKTSRLSPNIEDWTDISNASFPFGQHGMNFNSYQTTTPASKYPGGVLPRPHGVERNMYYDNDHGGEVHNFVFNEFSYGEVNLGSLGTISSFTPPVTVNNVWGSWSGAERDWDADSVYVTRKGVPVVYTMRSAFGENGLLYQAYDRQNSSLQTPHPDQLVTNTKDAGVGSLRRALGYGGNITIDPSLDGQTIFANGPLIVSLYDVNINASALSQGITIRANSLAPLIQVTAGNTLTMSGLKTRMDTLSIAVNPTTNPSSMALPIATGGSGNWRAQVATNHDGVQAAQSGAITDSQTSYLQSAVTGPGTLTFWWKVSSQVNFDFLHFTLDGVEQAGAVPISGNVDWQQKTIPIPAGNHQLRWTYAKDSSGSSGSDAGWVDEVDFAPAPPVITSPLTASGTQGIWLDYDITATQTQTPISYYATGLPAGLFVNPNSSGIYGIRGIPAVSGTFTVRVFASNAGGTGSASLTITIAPSGILVGNALDLPDQPMYLQSTFFGQATTTHDGVDAVKSAAIGDSGLSKLDTVIWGQGTLTFWWKVSSQAGSDFLRFRLDGAEQPTVPAISGEVNWQQVTVELPTGLHYLTWSYGKDASGSAGADAGWIDQVIFVPSLAQALDTPPINWTTSGNAGWAGQTVTTHTVADVGGGGLSPIGQRDAAQSGLIGDLGQSSMETTVTGPATLTFWWKVSSENVFDVLRFHLDGAEQPGAPAISGEVDWQQKTISIPGGNHQLRWTYSKDGSASEGADAGWVDQVVLTPGHPITSPLTATGAQGTPFSYQITAPNAPPTFDAYLDEFKYPGGWLPAGLYIAYDTGLISGTPTVSGDFNITLWNYSAWGPNTATLALTIGPSAINLATAVDATNLTWTTGGAGTWYGQPDATHDSVDAARSSSIGDLEETDLETTVTGPGMLTFWWKVSSEENSDYLRFTLDDAQEPGAPQISGEVDWQQQTIAVPAGSHVLTWTYLKDGTDSAGSDGGWVDEVIFISGLVTTTNDSGPGSLRQVIADLPADAIINFDPGLSGQTITLVGSSLVIGKNLTIDAVGLADGITISGGGTHRIFTVNSGASFTLRGLTLISGDAGADFSGGAVFGDVNSTLNLDRCTLTGNNAVQGGALFNAGTMTASQCTLTGNTGSYGGAIQCVGLTTIIRCTITGNDAYAGGGIFNKNTSLSVEYSIVAGNTAGGGGGPDVFNENALLEYSGSNLVQSVASSGTGSVTGPAAINAAPLLAPLGNYGGPTQTMPPLPGSPAVDAADTPILTFSDILRFTDIRGLSRLVGSAVDIGAAELQLIIATSDPVFTGLTKIGTGAFQFSFTSQPWASFTVFSSTDVALPLDAWSYLGPVLETSPGSGGFQFTDSQATNRPQTFYRLRSP